MRAAVALAASSVAMLGGCAVVFGLDEPTVRDGSGGDATTSVSVGDGTADGTGGGGGTASSGDSSSGSGGAECQTASDCDDANRCTDDDCDLGACVHTSVPDAPLEGDPTDCVKESCRDGVEVTEPDDTEDPPDPHAPCETVSCEDGVPTFVNAPSGEACGSPPSTCDGAGRCRCDASASESCGPETACAEPSCEDEDGDGTGSCEFGYLGPEEPVDDTAPGDCLRTACTGESAVPLSVPDPSDLPSSPCAVCADEGGTTNAAEGAPCLGQVGVCDGLGQGASSCHECLSTADDMDVDPGCAEAAPHCDDEGQVVGCQECLKNEHCGNAPNGSRCEDAICGCNFDGECASSTQGRVCIEENGPGPLDQGVCGCMVNDDCASRVCDLVTNRCM